MPALVDAFFERRSDHSARTGLLGEDDEPDIARIGARLELGFNLAAEIFSLLKPANLGQIFEDGNVGQMFPAIFAAQNLRLRVIESNGGSLRETNFSGLGSLRECVSEAWEWSQLFEKSVRSAGRR